MLSLLFILCACDVGSIFEEPTADCTPHLEFHPDEDGDGLGNDTRVFIGCEAPEGYVSLGGDCDDSDPDIQACPETGLETGD